MDLTINKQQSNIYYSKSLTKNAKIKATDLSQNLSDAVSFKSIPMKTLEDIYEIHFMPYKVLDRSKDKYEKYIKQALNRVRTIDYFLGIENDIRYLCRKEGNKTIISGPAGEIYRQKFDGKNTFRTLIETQDSELPKKLEVVISFDNDKTIRTKVNDYITFTTTYGDKLVKVEDVWGNYIEYNPSTGQITKTRECNWYWGKHRDTNYKDGKPIAT